MTKLDFESQFEKDKLEIPDEFRAKVINVHDGDTIKVQGNFRKKPVDIRLADIDAPEIGKKKGEPGGEASKEWLKKKVLNKEVDIVADPKGKFGKYRRMIAYIKERGLNINEESMFLGFSKRFGLEDPIPTTEKKIKLKL